MSILTNLLSLLGNNNLIPAVIPSLAFVLISLVVFDPFIKASELLQQQVGIDLVVLFSLIVLLPVIILSYTLIALNPYLLKVFEGNFSPRPRFMHQMMVKSELRKVEKIISQLKETKREIQRLEQKSTRNGKQDSNNNLDQLRQRYYSTAAAYDQNYPHNLNDIGPTAVGNILKSAESYASTRYGMDGVVFWSRLIQVIPKEYREAIDASRNELAFLSNFSLLSMFFYYSCLLALLFNFPKPIANINATVLFSSTITPGLKFLLLGLLALISNWFFNEAARHSVRSYGVLMRSAYDLFRLDLLEQFRVKIPRNSAEEFYVWKNINELILMGQNSLDFKPIKYTVKSKETSSRKRI